MQKIALSENLQVSPIAYGLWRSTDDPDQSCKHLQQKIEACLEQGITTFDQADIYGGYSAETLLGNTFKKAPQLRQQMEIITKCNIVAPIGIHSDKTVKHYNSSPAYINAAVERSLREMAIDRIDLLLLHRPDPMMDADQTGPALDALIASGKVKTIGVSNFRPWDIQLLQSRTTSPLVTNQIEISLGHNCPFTNGDLAYLQQQHITPMAWSPLGGGKLLENPQSQLGSKLQHIAECHDVSTSAIAIAWLLAHPSHIIPIMGSNNLQRIKQFAQATQINLDRQTWFELLEAANGKAVA
jgi:predicted oxidoreductase